MSEDMPWVNGLTDEEVQELRSKKQELTEYGKNKLKELIEKNKKLTVEEKQLNIMWAVATSTSIETGTRPHILFARMLYDDFMNIKPPVELGYEKLS